jgi:hypothetical protein
MASTCCQSIPARHPHGSSFELDVQPWNPPASLGAQALGFTACFDRSMMDEPKRLDDRRLPLTPSRDQLLPFDWMADLSDDSDLPSLTELLRHLELVIDLTGDDDNDDDDEEDGDDCDDIPLVSWPGNHCKRSISRDSNLNLIGRPFPYHRSTPLTSLPFSPQQSASRTLDDHRAFTAATPNGEKPLWTNVLWWSPLHCKPRQHPTTPLHGPTADALHADTNSLESPLAQAEAPRKGFRALEAKRSEISPEVSKTPPAARDKMRLEDGRIDDGDIPSYTSEHLSTKIDRT